MRLAPTQSVHKCESMVELPVDKAELTADLFHMLIKELHGVQDEVQNMRADLGRILLPKIEDVTSDNVEELVEKLTEQDIVRSLGGRRCKGYTFLNDKLPTGHVKVLKDNGFRVSELRHRTTRQEPSTIIMWGDTMRKDVLMSHLWSVQEDFVDL